MEWFKTLLEKASIISDLTQKLNIEDKTRTLKRKMESLASKEADIRAQLDVEEKRPGKKRKEEVNDWSKKFERLSSEVNDVVQKVAKSTPFWQLTLGSCLDKLIREAELLHEEGRFPEGVTLDVDETRGYELPVRELTGQAFQSNLRKIWDYLMSEEVQSIGVQGMGGVGKTTLVTCIHNQIVKDCAMFESSFWVTVSRDCSVKKLQDAIAKHLRLDLENHSDENIRAGQLWRALCNRKLVIILDDVWEYYPLEKVGISLKRNGCKLILTSRKKDVCYQMNCNKLVEVTTLPEQEAWCLFRDNLRHDSLLSPDVKEIAQAVVKECAGLPLGIMVLSGMMRGVNDIHEWWNTLKELQESKFKAKRMEEEVFTILRFSYEHLSDSIIQQCFLHITLYPEDEEVDKGELIHYFIDSGLIERGSTRKTEFDKGYTILNKLIRSCLLEEGRELPSSVKMHDLVRDTGINITNGRFMVKAGQQLTEISDEREWVESLERVSLMSNDIRQIALDASPRCPNISTLFLQRNPLVSVPNSFFRYMQSLQILNLSLTKIKELPDYFSDLVNLTALHLSRCLELRYVPSLAKMRALRTLNLYRSGIEELPQGMERLHSLTYLDLRKTEGLEGMQWPTGILLQLSHLQYLNFMEGPKIMKAEELKSLRKLERLRCWFDNEDEFSTCMRYLQSRTSPVNHWDITLGRNGLGHIDYMTVASKMVSICKCNMEGKSELFQLPNDVDALHLEDCQGITSMSQWRMTFSELKQCDICRCKGMEMVINGSQQCTLFPKLKKLTIWDMRDLRAMISNSLKPNMAPSSGNFFSSLTDLVIYGCPRIKKLLTPLLLPLLTHVEQMTIVECEELEEIIAIKDDDHVDPILSMPKLCGMELEKLPQLKTICGTKWMMKCDSLTSLVIMQCPKLERIPMELHIPLDRHREEDPIPSSLASVLISSIPGWSDRRWEKRMRRER